jgi:uncharacterized membrane protein YeaQ/YmgE (transglycosylase-associated protein family)
MNLLTVILWLAVVGLIVGGLARLVLPGVEGIGMGGTILAGLAGSLVGGFVGRLLFGSFNWLVGLILAVLGALIFIWPYRVVVVRRGVTNRGVARTGFFGARDYDDRPGYVRDRYDRPGFFGGRMSDRPGLLDRWGLGGRRGFWNRRRRSVL